jgi:hypothetical protein
MRLDPSLVWIVPTLMNLSPSFLSSGSFKVTVLVAVTGDGAVITFDPESRPESPPLLLRVNGVALSHSLESVVISDFSLRRTPALVLDGPGPAVAGAYSPPAATGVAACSASRSSGSSR